MRVIGHDWNQRIVTKAWQMNGRRRETVAKNANGRERGSVRAHSYSWSLSSPQQPLETEDSPTVSLAPKYTSQRSCRARKNPFQLLVACFSEVLTNRPARGRIKGCGPGPKQCKY